MPRCTRSSSGPGSRLNNRDGAASEDLYDAPAVARNRSCSTFAALLAAGLALAAGGCSLSMPLAGLQPDPETTASLARPAARLDPALDDEDWRRAQSALSLAVDPQGSGEAVNWDNPATRRKGSFVPAGKLVLVENTVCRPFRATLSDQQAGKPHEARMIGQACRTGPGAWAMREVKPEGTTASLGAPGALRAEAGQPLPIATSSMLPAPKAETLPDGMASTLD